LNATWYNTKDGSIPGIVYDFEELSDLLVLHRHNALPGWIFFGFFFVFFILIRPPARVDQGCRSRPLQSCNPRQFFFSEQLRTGHKLTSGFKNRYLIEAHQPPKGSDSWQGVGPFLTGGKRDEIVRQNECRPTATQGMAESQALG
jgi:hypothetical protein